MVKGVARAAQLRGHLGARIRVLREARDLTQEDLAGRIGISAKYVSQIECGQRSPSWETVVALAYHGFGVTVASLMFGIDEDIPVEVKEVSELLAGRSKEACHAILQALKLVLGPGSKK